MRRKLKTHRTKRESPATPDPARLPGVISAFEAYTIDELKLRLGIRESSIRQARLNGLRVAKLGRHRIILGEIPLAYLRATPPHDE